ncbi:MAG TPA: aminotransferase class I/II-fold pyridoxal phosphate-dependent enzyme [Ktedonobacterales bacterium]|jgi:aspartate/methionine/tyrosine aminotransferase
MKSLMPGIQALNINPILQIAALASQQPGCIRLETGEPDFRTPEHIRRAAIEAIEQRSITYGPPPGLPSLRQALAARVQRVNGYTISPDEISVAPGGSGALMAAIQVICGPGDEALTPDPAWPMYEHMLACVGARPAHYRLHPETGWLPDLDELERLVTPRTRALIINSPANPTGAVFPRALLEQVIAFAQRHDLYLISDEAYDELVYEGEHISPAALCDDGRVISAYTFSKNYAMTGWRIGYAVARPQISKAITVAVSAACTNVSHVAQWAAEAALAGPQDCVADMRASYHQRRDAALEVLRTYGISARPPKGAFYLMIDISSAGLPSLEFALRLLKERNISVAPGSAFGETIDGYVRVSLASALPDLQRGIAGLCEYMNDCQQRANS